MNLKETKILETGDLVKIESPQKAIEYINYLFDNYTKWKPLFFDEIDTDINAINHNQKIRHEKITAIKKKYNCGADKRVTDQDIGIENMMYLKFTYDVDEGLELVKDASFVLMKKYSTKLNAKEDMFESAKAEFNNRLENSFDEKLFIENELQKFTDFENRAKELQKEVYKNDAVLNEYQRQYENKYGWHFSEFEYLRMITGFYHYPERENKKSFYFLPTLVKHKLLKNYILEIYNQKFNLNNDTRPTGFYCELPEPTVEQIFEIMQANDQISGNSEDFKAIFSREPKPVTKPVTWKIKSQKKPYRGHQIKLYLFIETMLNRKLLAKDIRKAVNLFIDEKGQFLNPKMKEPSKHDRNTHNIFEKLLKDAIEKTRPV